MNNVPNQKELIEKELLECLRKYKNVTIALSKLEDLFPGDISYEEIAVCIKKLVNDDILKEINPKNNNGKKIPLPYKFEINKYNLNKGNIEEIQKFALTISHLIDLQSYYKSSEKTWKRDLPYIKKVNEYIENGYLNSNFKTSQEVSFDICKDEKWIDEKGGRKLLENINIWDKLKINHSNDPLMMAVNPHEFNRKRYAHLIVENKATFLELMDTLKDTAFTSLIFGSGWKIVSNIRLLEKQLNLSGEHVLYYFGDLDYEGISIWNLLNEKRKTVLAVDFYSAMLKKKSSKGKETQNRNLDAANNFLTYFDLDEQKIIRNILTSNSYLPQESLNKEELQNIWRKIKWI